MSSIELHRATADDVEQLCALVNRSESADGVPRVMKVEELHEEFDGEQVNLDRDVRTALVDGSLAGFVYTYHLPSDVKEERCFVFGYVDPVFRGCGAGRALMRWGTDRGTEQLRSSANQLPKYLRVSTYDYIESTNRLFARMGFQPVRYFDELLRPLTDLPPVAAIDGSTIIPWPLDRMEELRATKNAAFLDHWGSTPTSVTNWDHLVNGFGGRPDLSFAAADETGAIVSLLLSKRFDADDDLTGRRDGWIDTLATLREWRGRGIASALIATALDSYARAGLTHASITVDSANPTGAAQLYESLGFRRQQRSIQYQIQVGGEPAQR